MTTATEGTELQSADAQDEGGKGKEPLDLGHEVMPKQPVTAATATEPDEGEDTGKVSNGIPRARMNEVIRQREAAQAEAEELRREIERLRAGQGGAAPAPASPASLPRWPTSRLGFSKRLCLFMRINVIWINFWTS